MKKQAVTKDDLCRRVIVNTTIYIRNEEDVNMATPISPTPVLNSKEAVEFQKRLDADLKRPVSLVATPNIGKARELIRQHASKYKK